MFTTHSQPQGQHVAAIPSKHTVTKTCCHLGNRKKTFVTSWRSDMTLLESEWLSRLNSDRLEKWVFFSEMTEAYKIIIVIKGLGKDWLFPLLMQRSSSHQKKVAGDRFTTSKRRLLTKQVIHRYVELPARWCCGCRNIRLLQGVPEYHERVTISCILHEHNRQRRSSEHTHTMSNIGNGLGESITYVCTVPTLP